MTFNFPGPYEVRIFYTVDVLPGGPLEHQLRLSCVPDGDPVPGTPFDEIDILRANGSPGDLAIQTLGVVNVIEDFLNNTDATIDRAELWKYTPGTFVADFISSYIINQNGTNVSATVPCSQSIWTMRTVGGGIFKVVVLDGTGAQSAPQTYAQSNQDNKNLFDFFTAPTAAPFVARDNSFPFSPLKVFVGQNEHLFKVRYSR